MDCILAKGCEQREDVGAAPLVENRQRVVAIKRIGVQGMARRVQ